MHFKSMVSFHNQCSQRFLDFFRNLLLENFIRRLANGFDRANLFTLLAENTFCGVNLLPLTDILHDIDIHRTDFIAGPACGTGLTRGPFPYDSNRCRDLHYEGNRTEDQTEGPSFFKKIGKENRTRKIEAIADQKPSKLSPLSKPLVDMKGHVVITGIEEHHGYA